VSFLIFNIKKLTTWKLPEKKNRLKKLSPLKNQSLQTHVACMKGKNLSKLSALLKKINVLKSMI